MATGVFFGRDLSDMFNYSDAVRKALNNIVIILPQSVSVATTKRLSEIFRSKPISLTNVCRLCCRNYRLLCVVVSC